MPDTETLKPKHWFVPNELRDTAYDEANQNNWAWPEARMKRNARALWRMRLFSTVGITLAGVLAFAGFIAQAFIG
jgi:hypothetical protein